MPGLQWPRTPEMASRPPSTAASEAGQPHDKHPALAIDRQGNTRKAGAKCLIFRGAGAATRPVDNFVDMAAELVIKRLVMRENTEEATHCARQKTYANQSLATHTLGLQGPLDSVRVFHFAAHFLGISEVRKHKIRAIFTGMAPGWCGLSTSLARRRAGSVTGGSPRGSNDRLKRVMLEAPSFTVP